MWAVEEVDGRPPRASDRVAWRRHARSAGAFEKLPWYETRTLHLALALGFVACFVAAPVGVRLARRSRKVAMGALDATLVTSLSVLNLVTLVGTPLAVARLDRWEFMYGIPPVIVTLLWAPLPGALAAAVLAATSVRGWRQRRRSGFALLWSSGLLAVELAFLVWLNYWNLLGFRA